MKIQKKKFVYIAHPYRAPTRKGVISNFDKARDFARKAWTESLIPIVPHFNSSGIFGLMGGDNDDITDYDLHLLSKCDKMWVCGGKISKGMRIEINFCKNNGIEIEYKKHCRKEMIMSG